MADSDFSTLQKIITKVRRLTRSPSTAQITDAIIKDYVNIFILYDLPQHLRDSALRRTLTFFATPYVDTYETDAVNPNSPLFNFINRYITVHPPLYIAGNLATLHQARSSFYSLFPATNTIQSIGAVGNGVATNFTGTLSNRPVLQNHVMFTSRNITNDGLTVVDLPYTATSGGLVVPGTTTILGMVNYVTGSYVFTLPSAPANGAAINSQTVPYVPAQPTTVLYFENKFTLRPVPDQPYRIDLEAYLRPDELDAGDMPLIAEWWQYIAYGAAKKVFEDRMDQESVQLILPEFKEQETLVLRRTIIQQSNKRASTVYSDLFNNNNPWGYGNGTF